MLRLTGLQIMAIIEIDKLMNELKMVNDQIVNPGVPETMEHNGHINTFKSMTEKQAKLIEQLENWTRTLNESVTTDNI